jgi:DNA-binding MltR family transcriptional regulator
MDEPPALGSPEDDPRQTATKIVTDWVDHLIDTIVSEIKEPIDISALKDFYISLGSESDRGLAVLVAALVEDVLKETYLRVLNPKAPLKDLVSMAGPLGNVSMRINMAFALRWITEPIYRNLRAMQRIRNRFAHERVMLTFDSPRIQPLVTLMTPSEDALYASSSASVIPDADLTWRHRFLVRSMYTCSTMIVEMTGAPLSIAKGLSPMAHLSRGPKGGAPMHHAALLAAAEATLELLRQPGVAAAESSAEGPK